MSLWDDWRDVPIDHGSGVVGDRFQALKAAGRRKRRRPSGALEPLSPPSFSASSASRGLVPTDDGIDDADDDRVESDEGDARPPRCPLPPLEMQILQRRRLFLSPTGAHEPVIGIEEIVRYHEMAVPGDGDSSVMVRSPLQLPFVPRRCVDADEIALMPCHSLLYRYVPSLAAELWREPIRDRDKHWAEDELRGILLDAQRRESAAVLCRMSRPTNVIGGVKRAKWRRLDAQRLQIHRPHDDETDAATSALGLQGGHEGLPPEVLLRTQGAMISRSYCIVSIYGVGLYGRLYGEGMQDRHGQRRFLRVRAYEPRRCRTFELQVSLGDLERLFVERPELLAAGHKPAILQALLARLFFEYPPPAPQSPARADAGDDDDDDREIPHATPTIDSDEAKDKAKEGEDSEDDGDDPGRWPVLRISPVEALNEAARRRLEREERLRLEEAERLRRLAELLRRPRRARHRVVCELVRISGHRMTVSIYHFPTQVRNFVIVAYHPRTSRTFQLSVGVQEAASLARVFALPHKWTPEQKHAIARALVPRLHLRGLKPRLLPTAAAMRSTSTPMTPVTIMKPEDDDPNAYRLALAIREDRMGAQGPWLALAPPPSDTARQSEALAKYNKDGQQGLLLELDRAVQGLGTAMRARHDALQVQITAAESSLVALRVQDAELKGQIEDLDGGKGVPLGVTAAFDSKRRHHESRRNLKAARKTIKDETKSLQARLAGWTHELTVLREQELVDRERLRQRHDKALGLLAQQALTATMALWFDPASRRPLPGLSHSQGNRQMTVRHRRLLRSDEALSAVAAGGCRLDGRSWRFSLFVTDGGTGNDKQEQVATAAGAGDATDATDNGHATNDGVSGRFTIELYDARACLTLSIALTRLEVIAYTKAQHDAQLRCPGLQVPTSPVVARVRELDEAYEQTRRLMLSRSMNPSQAKKKSDVKKRQQALRELTLNRREHRELHRLAPWDRLLRELCGRLTVRGDALVLDRCIYRADVTIVLVTNDDDDSDARPPPPTKDDEANMIPCHVRVTTDGDDVVRFDVEDPSRGPDETWSLVYPESVELLKEMAVESPVELELHLEAIAMTLLFFIDPATHARQLRFEE